MTQKTEKLVRHTTRAESLLENILANSRLNKVRIDEITKLIRKSDLSNIKRAYLMGFLHGKFKVTFTIDDLIYE